MRTNIDVVTCSKCDGKMKIITAIEDPKVIRKILEHMGLKKSICNGLANSLTQY